MPFYRVTISQREYRGLVIHAASAEAARDMALNGDYADSDHLGAEDTEALSIEEDGE